MSSIPESWEVRKYRSIWQILNARNTMGDKYRTIECVVDGLREEDMKKLVEKVEKLLKNEYGSYDFLCCSQEFCTGHHNEVEELLDIIKEHYKS